MTFGVFYVAVTLSGLWWLLRDLHAVPSHERPVAEMAAVACALFWPLVLIVLTAWFLGRRCR